MINLRLLTDFLHLVQSRNFSTTAGQRGMAQSSLSRHIAQLEAYVGAPIFDRSIQPVALTPAGERLVPLAQSLLETAEDIRAIGHPDVGAVLGQINLIALSSLAMSFFPGWLSHHDSAATPWRMNLLNTEPLLAANIGGFLRGKADFLLTFGHDSVGDLHALRHHRYIVLGQDRARPVSAPGPDGTPLWSLDRPGTANYCGYTRGSFYQQALQPMLDRRGDRLHLVRDNSLAAVLQSMVRQGHGLSWLPSLLCDPDLASGSLVRAGGPDHDLTAEIRLYRSHNMGRYAREFWSCVSAGQAVVRKELRTA